MLVLEELKKRNIPWEQFILSSHMKLDIDLNPQSNMQSPLPYTSTSPIGTRRKRKSKAPTQYQEVIKETE
jgi:hypothetical protein